MASLCLVLLLFTCGVCSFSKEVGKDIIEPEYLDSLLRNKNYEEFARILDIENVDFVNPMKKNSSRPMFMKGLYHGDIMLTKSQSEQARQGVRFDTDPEARWPGNPAQVAYTISDEYPKESRKNILDSVAEWNKLNPCVQWVERKKEKDYVNFYPGNGCWSHVGKVGGAQSLSLEEPGCVALGIALHEMNHAIGFLHEQERWDRDDYIRMLWDNIPEEWKGSYDKSNPDYYGIQDDYDFYSLMHYTVAAPDTDDLPAYEVLKDGIDEDRIGHAPTLSKKDRKKIRILYC